MLVLVGGFLNKDMKEFRQFLIEIDTIGHTLKFRRRREQSEVTAISSVVETLLLAHYPAYKTLPDDRHRLVNFLTEVVIQAVLFRGRIDRTNALSTFVNQEPRTRDGQIKRQVDMAMELFGDYVFGAPWKIVRSQLNDPRYIVDSPSSLMPHGDPKFERFTKASQDWHRQLAKSGGRGSKEFRVLIDLSSLGGKWKGYQWVSLDRSYCEQEKKAMGHCGNANYKHGDNILSLRDKKNRAYLTFIINDGILGEMKGRGNDKPARKYHPAIIQLLLHPDVKAIRGGGYLPKSNFKFSDLSSIDQQRIRSQKPILAESPLIAMLMLNRMDMVASILGLDSSMNPVYDSTTHQLILCKLPHNDHKSRNLPYDLVSDVNGSRYEAIEKYTALSWLPFYPDKWEEKRFFYYVREPLPKQLSETEDIIEPRLRRIIYEKTDADDFEEAIQDRTIRKFLTYAYKFAVGSYVASSLREAVIKTFVPNSDRTASSPAGDDGYYAGTDIWVNFTDNTLRTTVDSLRDLSVWLDTNETEAARYDMITHIKRSGYFPWREERDVLDEYPDPKTYNKYLSRYLSPFSPDY